MKNLCQSAIYIYSPPNWQMRTLDMFSSSSHVSLASNSKNYAHLFQILGPLFLFAYPLSLYIMVVHKDNLKNIINVS